MTRVFFPKPALSISRVQAGVHCDTEAQENRRWILSERLAKRCWSAVGLTAETAAWRCVVAAFVDLSLSTEPESAYVTLEQNLANFLARIPVKKHRLRW